MASLINGLGGTAGFGENSLARGDDGPSISIDLTSVFGPTGLNFFGKTYTSLFLNYNGSVSFGVARGAYSPSSLTAGTAPMITPFWADIDTLNAKDKTSTPGGTSKGTNLIWYDLDVENHAFTATWDDVGYYNQHNGLANAFQLRLVGKDNGDFDIEFYYEAINWLTGDNSGGTNGLGGNMAHAGYTAGNGNNFFELPESGTTAMLSLPALGNVPEQPGVFRFEVRHGTTPLFTAGDDTIDFNFLTENQRASVAAGNDAYHGGGGSDTVVLPVPGKYNQIVSITGDPVVRLNWNDATAFATESRAGDQYSVTGGAGNHVIVAGAGNDSIIINGDGNNHITAGSGHTTVFITSAGGNNTIVGGTGEADIQLQTGSANNHITAGSGDLDIDIVSGDGNNTFIGGEGRSDVKIETTGNGSNTITTGTEPTSQTFIDITMNGSGNNTINSASGILDAKIDSTNGTGTNEITIELSLAEIEIKNGVGSNAIRAIGTQFNGLTITIFETTGKGSNTISLGDYRSVVKLVGTSGVAHTGAQAVYAGDGPTTLSFDGAFRDVTVVGNDVGSPFEKLTYVQSTDALTLEGKIRISQLEIDPFGVLTVEDGGVVFIDQIDSLPSVGARATINVEANASLELGHGFQGRVNLGTGSSTLILDRPDELGVAGSATGPGSLQFELGDLATGDKIVLKGLNPTTQQIAYAALGSIKIDDFLTAPMLELGNSRIPIGAINNDFDFSNVYVDVSLTGGDTILTLKDGNNVDAALQGPAARSRGVTGSGIKIGIIANSFASDEPGYQRDKLLGSIPAINPLKDQPDGAGPDIGRAMAGVLHAIAKDAELFFYAASNPAEMAEGVQALRQMGCQIIVDDLHFDGLAEYFSSLSSVIGTTADIGVTQITGAGARSAFPIGGHAALADVITVAAMNVLAVPTAAAPGGRYFTAQIDKNSAVGVNGKPDVTGVDGGQSTFFLGNDLNPFTSTAAAAASVAGVVALMMDANPLLATQPGEVARILKGTALDFGVSSAEAGAGLVQADKAVAVALSLRQNFLTSPPGSAGLAVPDGLSPGAAPAQPVSAALSIPAGNAGTGLTVMLLVEMGQAVTVSGAPNLALNSGGTFTYDAALSSPDQGRLLFGYTVSGTDQASLLAITGVSGTVKDVSGADVDLSPLIGKATGLTINSPLTVTAVTSSQTGTVMAGAALEITITLDHAAALISTGGLPTLTLNVGAVAAFDAAKSDLAAGKLVFDYMVAAGQATPSLTIASLDLPDGSTIRDVNGNNADFTLALDHAMGVQVGPAFVAAVLPEIEMTSMGVGQTVEVTIALSQGVVVDRSKGSPTLALGNGAAASYDAASSDPTKGLLVFDYKVAAGDQATANLLVSKIALNGATIRDTGGIDVDLGGAQNAPTGLTIGSPLTVASTVSSKAGILNLGETAKITVTMSAGLQVLQARAGGLSTFALNDGGQAVLDLAASNLTAGKLVFDYTVLGSDHSVGALAISQFNQNGGIFFDSNGNFADFSGALGAALGLQVVVPDPATATIVPDSAAKAEGNSGTSAFTFTVTLDKAVGSTVTMDWSVTGNIVNSVTANDFAGGAMPYGTLVFSAGETVKTITVAIQGDTTSESDEIFTVSLARPTGAVVFGTASATGTVENDETTVSIAATGASKAEGNAGTTVFTFTVTRSDAFAAQSVAWSVTGQGGAPASTADFAGGTLPSGIVTFAAGETTRTITVGVQGDQTTESDESFAVTLANPSAGLTIATASASGVIVDDDASVSIAAADASKAEGSTGTTAFTFTVTRLGSTVGTHSVAWSVAGSGTDPAHDTDFTGGTLPSGSVTFAPGETTRTITIDVQGDQAVESNEAFVVTLASPAAGLTIATASANGSIQNDDASVSIIATDASKAEGNGATTAFTFTLTRSGDGSTAQSVAWAVTGSGANPANAADFAGGTLPSGSVSFGVGETTRTIVIDVQGDMTVESDEDFTVTLANASAGLAIGIASAAGTIVNDDTAVTITASDASKAEGNGGTTVFTFTVTRSGDTSGAQSVAWSVAGSGANPANPSDFAGGALPTGTVSFAAGETARTIAVNVQGDSTAESGEGFTATLANPSAGLTIATASASGTIQNDDASVSIAATSASKAEGNTGTTAFTFTVTRTGNTATAQSVAWSVAGSGASPATASDFAGTVLPTGSVTFDVGETAKTVTVNVQGDTTSESDEGFAVTLANASAGLIIAAASASGTIQNDDAGPLTAHDDAFVALRGSNIVVSAANGVLFNDEGGSFTVSLKTNAGHGNLQLGADGGFSYAPQFGFAGVDTFAYRATSAGNFVDAEVALIIVPVVASPTSTTLDLLALDSDQQIAATYAAFFGRAADAAGFQFWVGEFNRGLPTQGPATLFANIASSFGISAEAQALYPFLANPFGASDVQISAFIDSVYNNLFNRSSDAGGLAYWTGEIRNALANNQFVGSVLVNIMSGAQDTANGKDITSLMGKVAVSIDYVHEQQEHNTQWAGASDLAAATSLLDAVTSSPQSILAGIKTAESLIANHA